MYRQKIREYYEHLSPSYRKVADYTLARYYDVAFMTAAQLAEEVGVDTTTIVRFSQRLGYNGYPELLSDIRAQVKDEVYTVHQPQSESQGDPVSLFHQQLERDIKNLQQTLIQNPPELLADVIQIWQAAERIYFVAEGYANGVAEGIASQLRQRGIQAEAVAEDPVRRASALANLSQGDVVMGVCSTEFGESVVRSLDFAKMRGCVTLGIVGSLDSPVNRVADRVLYAPADLSGQLASIVSLTAVLSALAELIITQESRLDPQQRVLSEVYHFLTRQNGGNERAAMR
jgi:DNA-binding MurR/RpiR family transcriptional regulator